MNNPEYNKKVLNLLGIGSPEQIRVAQNAINNHALEAAALIGAVPSRLFALVPLLLQDDYQNRMGSIIQIPLEKASIDEARKLVIDHFADLPKHPAFDEARMILVTKHAASKSGSQVEPTQMPELPSRNIESINVSPLLGGLRPPYAPLIKLKVSDGDNTPLISDMFTWPDLIFLSMAILQGVSNHVEAAGELIATKKIMEMDSNGIKHLVIDSRKALDIIERFLATNNQGESVPEGKS